MRFALLRRGGEGFALIAVLGCNYLIASWLGRIWSQPGQAWRDTTHRLGAPWFASFCKRHGALMLKIGQVVASRPDVLPLAYVDACSDVRDQAPARPFAVVKRALERAYEGRIDEHLIDIEPQPLAAASFGQVHRARLRDGTPVAVKIQYPDLGARVALDLILLRITLKLFGLITPGWPLDPFIEEISRTSREEQDYLCEATAAERLRPLLAKHRIDVPQVRFEHTRDTVLVMQFAAGTTFARTDLDKLTDVQRADLADRIIDAWIAMLLDEGFFHGDPHGGNFIVDADPTADGQLRLWLIDFGMTASISARERLMYTRFLRKLAENDIDGMVDELVNLGVLLPDADITGVRAIAREIYSQLATINPRAFKNSRREKELSNKVAGFLRRARGIAFPRHTILLTRALGLVEGLTGELVPEKSLLTIARPRLARLRSIRTLVQDAWTDARERLQRFLDLPNVVERALKPTPNQGLVPVVAAVVLLAATQIPDPYRLWACGLAGLAVVASLLRR